MSRPSPLPRALVALLALASAACQLPQAKVWNLQQVHEPDGTPKRRGDLKGDLEYVVEELFLRSGYGGAEFEAEQAKKQEESRIDDPLGTCLENLIDLGECRRDERVAALQAAAFAWLAVDCTYVLSRERALLELGPLAIDLGVRERPELPPGAPAAVAELTERFDELVAATNAAREAPAAAGDELRELCGVLLELPMERPAALRLLRTTIALLAEGERTAVLAPLRELRLDLARRCTILALRDARAAVGEGGHGRPLAAALESSLRAFPGERAELLRWALTAELPEVAAREELSLQALRMLAEYGAPPPSGDVDPAEHERSWTDVVLVFLVAPIDGPHTLAACRAMAKLTGEPLALRPEAWVLRALEQGRPEPPTP